MPLRFLAETRRYRTRYQILPVYVRCPERDLVVVVVRYHRTVTVVPDEDKVTTIRYGQAFLLRLEGEIGVSVLVGNAVLDFLCRRVVE